MDTCFDVGAGRADPALSRDQRSRMWRAGSLSAKPPAEHRLDGECVAYIMIRAERGDEMLDERQVKDTISQFGHVAHLWSTHVLKLYGKQLGRTKELLAE